MIIITGASEGLGAAIAQAAQTTGETVANIARRPNENAEENIIADLSTLEGIDAAAAAIRNIASPTALVLNAGVLSLQSIESADAEEYERVMNVNLRAPLLLVAKLYDWLCEHGVDIVVIGSIAGR